MGVQRKDRKYDELSGWKKLIVASRVAVMIMQYVKKDVADQIKGNCLFFAAIFPCISA